ncbi:MAG: hypothetical protein DRN08_07500, partial [Thermoplasmata archaeon]
MHGGALQQRAVPDEHHLLAERRGVGAADEPDAVGRHAEDNAQRAGRGVHAEHEVLLLQRHHE